jgi:hypothetical protein
MYHELKQEAIRLRVDEEWSYNAIREKLGVSKSTLHQWLKHFPLSRERIVALRQANWTKNQAKTDDYRIALANTNPVAIRFFIRWLGIFFDVPKEKIKAELHLYPTMDIPKEFLFWKNELGFTDDQFYKTQIRKLQKSSFSYRESFRHGTCSLNFSSVEKKMEIMEAIRAFLDHSSSRA